MIYENLIVEKKGNVAQITINRPRALNALNEKTRSELVSAIGELEEEGEIRAIILTGAGDRAFSAGQDLKESESFSGDRAKIWIEEHHRLYDRLINTTKPIIASIKGYSIGAGFQIALLADFRLCADNAKFAFTEINVGIPTITGTGTLWHHTNMPNIKELVFTGDIIDAQKAKEMGLVNKVVPIEDLERETLEFAQKLASKPRTAMELNKRLFAKMIKPVFDEIFVEAVKSHSIAFASGEPGELMKAFLEKKK